MGLPEFNDLDEDTARERLAACLPVPRWVQEVLDGRPYAGWPVLEQHAAAAAAVLSDDELDAALAGHPRIGERPSSPEHEAELSTREQSGVDVADPEVAAALADGNAAYESRFDRVFIIRAAGRSAPEVLEELRRRLRNDEATERRETVHELRDIALLRLREVAT
ncbi:2-oxo-4-hydroxy-4-carboxy-5-ureidoimidazoline decarboxylase [Pedococcus sp. 5OH_020]|uniref:2-oxo-4-hydroxy-4-carboxy-5-ureidoimidazoline decarboxylase n=1 Tax=Pedococcus sp. 5OH_020 TaxID=2989814 RepID=UPI0022E9FE79|nr:2-oxo-4-hydroxy-4-carboxy-5-ureidoimidazoline decarboxylase [Pedococcus sp. 5OH_020]